MVKLLLMPVAIAVVINARHSPPPMSVKVTLLPGPQVMADANARKRESDRQCEQNCEKNATAFCRGIDILKQRVEITRIVYRYKPRIATGVFTATLVVVPQKCSAFAPPKKSARRLLYRLTQIPDHFTSLQIQWLQKPLLYFIRSSPL